MATPFTWNGNSYPDGAKNLPDNRVGIAENFEYIEGKLGGPEGDHVWVDANYNKRGRHNQVAMPTQGDDGDPGVDLSVPTDTDGITFIKTIDTDKQVLHHNDGTTIRPLSWGTVWAYCVFDPDGAGGSPTITSSSNIDTGVGITYAAGVFTFTFVKAAPSANYMIFGSTTQRTSGVTSARTKHVAVYEEDGSTATTTTFQIGIVNSGGSLLTGSGITVTQAYVMVML
jgi:hypothetical protein